MPDRARRIVLTGASRGLGLELTRQLLAAGCEVFALARNPGASEALCRLREEHRDRLRLQACDVSDDASVKQACRAVAKHWRAIDLLLNNAGISGDRPGGLRDLDFEDLAYTFSVNALGPLRVTKGMLSLLRRGREPRIAMVTSLMGSIADDRSGQRFAYRMSKAALNMATRNLALELREKGIICIAIHPGWVQTEMGGPQAPLSREESVRDMCAVIDGLKLAQSGCFLDREGHTLPW